MQLFLWRYDIAEYILTFSIVWCDPAILSRWQTDVSRTCLRYVEGGVRSVGNFQQRAILNKK